MAYLCRISGISHYSDDLHWRLGNQQCPLSARSVPAQCPLSARYELPQCPLFLF
jgi:hypothetical protein